MLGALVMMVWAGWECVLRYDAMDGMTKAYMNLVKNNNIPLKEALKTIWETPEARKDWMNLIILAGIAVFALIPFFMSRYWKPGFLVIPACAAIMLYHTSDLVIIRALNLFETVKFASAGAIIFGESLNIHSALHRRRKYKKRLSASRKARRIPAHGTTKTLIPEHKKRGIGM